MPHRTLAPSRAWLLAFALLGLLTGAGYTARRASLARPR